MESEFVHRREFSAGEFWASLRNRGVSLVCPACGTLDQWNVGTLRGALPHVEGYRVDFHSGYEIIPTWCRKCGYTRFFSLTAYERGEGAQFLAPAPDPGAEGT